MIAAALFLSLTPPEDAGALLECARDQRVTLVASQFESGNVREAAEQARRDGAAYIWLQVIDQNGILIIHNAPDQLGHTLPRVAATGLHVILEPSGVRAEQIARAVSDAGVSAQTLIVVPDEASGAAVQAIDPGIGLVRTGLTDHYEVLSSELDQSRMAAWFEYFPDAHMEYFLAGQGIATIIPDFAFTDTMSAEDFALVRQQHIEILITDQTEDAIAVFGRAEDHCRRHPE